jgi:hypothetical protein
VLIRLVIDTAPPPRKNDPPVSADGRVVGRQQRHRRPPGGRRREGQHLKAIDAELVARTRLERLRPPGIEAGLRKTIDHAAVEVDKIEGGEMGEMGKKRRQRAEAIIIRELAAYLRPSKRAATDTPAAEQSGEAV